MAIEYLGLSAINGPMVVLEGVSGAAYDEIVEMTVDGNKRKLGRIIEVYEDKAVIQVFEGTEGMGLKNVHTRLTGHPMELGVSTEMLGRTMNGIGEPIDGLGEILPERMLDVNGKPLNPVTREYPRNYIRTGISAIDGLMTLIRGQKLPPVGGQPPAVCWQRQGQNTTFFAAVQPRQDQEGPASFFLPGVNHRTAPGRPSGRLGAFSPMKTARSAISPLTFPQVEGVL